MFNSPGCRTCMAPLQPEDGHDLCPSCLGLEHLREGLSENSCMNCGIMPRVVRAARLTEVEHLMDEDDLPLSGQLNPAQPTHSKRRATEAAGAPSKRAKPSRLSSRVDLLTAELAQMKSLLLTLHPSAGGSEAPDLSTAELGPEEDVISLAASANLFTEYSEGRPSHASGPGSRSSAQSSSEGAVDSTMGSIIRMALARLQLDTQQPEPPSASAFFRGVPAPSTFSVPPSEEYLRELHACWRDTGTLSRLTSDGRTLAAMQDAAKFGLARMPAVEPTIAALIVSPEETLRPDARCPRPQCRVTDDLLSRAYDTAARMGRIGNSLSHLMLALSASLQQATLDASATSLSDASLQAFALMSRELGRLMSTLVQTRRQVWLAQSPLSETYLGVPLRPPEAVLSPQLTPVAITGLSVPLGGQLATQTTLLMSPPDNLRTCGLTVAPPEPPEAGGPGDDVSGPADGFFSQQQISYWAAHASDPWVVSTQGYKLQFRRRPPASSRVKMTSITDPAKSLALYQELAALLAKGAIERVDPLSQPGGFYSTYFLVKKKGSGLRPVLDLRGLNKFLKVLPFHMLSTADVLRAVSRGEWFTSVDLKDAYFHVPIVPHHRQFLRFAFQGRHFQFRVLPFGLSLSPRVFTRCVAAALSPLQSQGMKILPYLDDRLICAPSRLQAAQDTARLLSHVARWGLKVNMEKSSLTPSQSITFIGVALDAATMRACPSPQRVDDILHSLSSFRGGRRLPYILFLRLLGKLTAASAVVPLGLLSLRPLQRWLNSLHLDAKWHRHRAIVVGKQCLLALSPWRERAYLTNGVPMGSVPFRREVVTTDACLSGWGAVWQNRTARGQWSAQDRMEHVNVLELRAVHLALKHFLPSLRGKHVLVRSDNTSAVFHINHQGGTRSLELLRVSRALLTWAAPRLTSLRAMYLPGERNQVADFLSRHKPPAGEWRLHPDVVQNIWGLFGRAEVDLFASETSTHCPHWFSLTERTSPLGQDALAHTWPEGLLYAFPPFPLILPTLLRVLHQGHRLLLVAPLWPARTWFSLLHRLCCRTPWRLPDRRDLLSQLGGQIWHPDPSRLQLWVWPLEGPTGC
ncbi:LOW QUALITY PROTEIN: uncharacterized protein [Cebidichthys violaceus]|uniref:LOW QUALITY PROTEIN: uncharacterized protein n=1 Tax=Cebidichthys violaceus TaxID=271503 RepID=UPI0035CBDD09